MLFLLAMNTTKTLRRSLLQFGAALYPLVTAVALGLPACATDEPAPGMIDDPAPDAALPGSDADPDAPALPVAGALDPSFGVGGIQPLDVGHGYAAALAVQDDKLLACISHIDGAAWTARVVRIGQDGQLDASFGTNGRITLAGGGNVSCKDVEVQRDGTIVVATYDVMKNETWSASYLADGSAPYLANPNVGWFTSKLTPVHTRDGFVVGRTGNGTVALTVISKQLAATAATAPIPMASITRVLATAADAYFAVAQVPDNGGSSWQVFDVDAMQTLQALGPAARAAAGTATTDLLHDAVLLSDGSIFAVGSMDSELEVMAARFVDGGSPTVDVEHHAHGGISSARAVTLDGAQRPIVVGTATANGKTAFGWQRYAATSVTLDAGYQVQGLAAAAPPSGNGELVDVVRLGGKLYALGSYDVETAAPKVALVRIVE